MVDTTSLSAADRNNVVSLRSSLDNFIKTNRGKIRSLLKAISYRLLGTLATVLITFALTQEIALSLSIGAFELVGKIVLFYLHERLWDKIS
ncbi:MAG: DUF2061 domain-containing protein [Ignavibacteriales bacterium]|nr:DUF2061 domain-containing protein [Ignavibacteriales bacterium]